MNWIPIEALHPQYYETNQMFVVIAKDVEVVKGRNLYTSEPYCVWMESTGEVCSRWPHPFSPTHYCELPTKFD